LGRPSSQPSSSPSSGPPSIGCSACSAGGLLGLIVYLVVAAVVLMISDKFVPGMKVNGFGGAIIAAIAIAVVSWLFGLLLGALGIVF
jgi:hypothetical protein